MTWLLATIGGGIGAVARYVSTGVIHRRIITAFPIGTLGVNLTGAFALGVIVHGMDGLPRAVLAGFLGGFTTFSTWMVETVAMADEGRGGQTLASLNLLLHLVGGLAAAGLGYWMGG